MLISIESIRSGSRGGIFSYPFTSFGNTQANMSLSCCVRLSSAKQNDNLCAIQHFQAIGTNLWARSVPLPVPPRAAQRRAKAPAQPLNSAACFSIKLQMESGFSFRRVPNLFPINYNLIIALNGVFNWVECGNNKCAGQSGKLCR